MNTISFNGNKIPAPSIAFWGYILFLVSYLGRLPARFPVLGPLRLDFFLAGFLIAIIIVMPGGHGFWKKHPISKALFSLFLYVLITLPVVEWPGSVVKNNLVPYIKAVVFFFFTVAFVDTERRLKILVFSYIVCQTVRVLEPLYLNITVGYWGSKTFIGAGEFANRLGGSPYDVVNPNGLAFVICIVWVYWHYIVSNFGGIIWKIAYLGMAALLSMAMVLTMSRSGFIALLVILGIFFYESKHKIKLVILATIAVAVAIPNMTQIQKERYLSLSPSSSVSEGSESVASKTASGRVRFIGRMADTYLNRPIVGHGLGTSREAGLHAGNDRKIAHSLYLEVLIELGLIGFIFYMVFIKRVYRSLQSMQAIIGELNQKNTQIGELFSYEVRLGKAITACFWMFLVFSIAYFGFSRSWWYFLAGLTVILTLHVESKIKRIEQKNTEIN